MVDPRSGIEILDAAECWRLLADHDVCRLAVSVGGQPDIFPLNYVVDEERLVFRTAPGSKLASVAINANVAVEIDGYDPENNTAWSVVAYGTAGIVSSEAEEYRLERLPLFPWNTSPKYNFVEVSLDDIAGRRFVAEGRVAMPSTASDEE
ncbi:MAG: pyridoxamine 5'-phosphate oxidase family protein [Actinobacteria bacterium]|nr:pyridoxamine 5'-phosphate oxidase family protein [Actinomycetota bacterium]